jgi:3-deoxy-7-phosphoheptulonate synthase
MIIVLKPLSSQSTIDRLTRRLEELGMKPHVIVGVERTVIAATGAEKEGTQAELEGDAEVEKVLPILAPYKIASRETRKDPTVVKTGSLTVGGGRSA